MVTVIILIALILLALGGYVGFLIGSHHIRQENQILKNNISHLERFSSMWAAEASGAYQLTNQVSQMNSNNLSAVMQNIVLLLSAYQAQNATGLNKQDDEKINQLIAQARSIASP